MTHRRTIAMITLSTGLNTILLAAPIRALHGWSGLVDYRAGCLVLLANVLVVVEGVSSSKCAGARFEINQHVDKLARRLALASSLALLAIYLAAMLASGRASVAMTVAGSGLFAAGIALRMAAMRKLGAMFRSEISILPRQTLVREGIYSFVRHPSETGLLLIGLGAAATLGSYWALAIWALVLTPLSLWRVALEDRCLNRAFGDEFRSYARTTPFLLPGILQPNNA